jgi:hypothetical protein
MVLSLVRAWRCLKRFERLVPHAPDRSRLIVAAKIHGPMLRNRRLAHAKGVPTVGKSAEDSAARFRFLRSLTNAPPREREFITATKIGPRRDIAVVAQFQRNAGIHVALRASA